MPRMKSPSGLERNLPPQAVQIHLDQGWILVDEEPTQPTPVLPEFGPESPDPEPEEA